MSKYRETVESEWWITSLTVAWNSLAEGFAISEVAGTSVTISVSGSAWQGRRWPRSSSASVRASSMESPGSNSPEMQNDLQVPQAPARQSDGRLIRAL